MIVYVLVVVLVVEHADVSVHGIVQLLQAVVVEDLDHHQHPTTSQRSQTRHAISLEQAEEEAAAPTWWLMCSSSSGKGSEPSWSVR